MATQYLLALQLQKGQEVYIDISALAIAQNFKPASLMEIDAFTMSFTKEEIIKAIADANIADGFLMGNLCIIGLEGKNKHVLPVLTKDLGGNFKIEQYLTNNLSNKALMNDLVNKFNSLSPVAELKQSLKEALKASDVMEICAVINQLPYEKLRELICYLLNNLEKEQKKHYELKLDKAA